jgi:hypothetical protein
VKFASFDLRNKEIVYAHKIIDSHKTWSNQNIFSKAFKQTKVWVLPLQSFKVNLQTDVL